MKFSIAESVSDAAAPEPRIGDVYPVKGGQWQGAKMWVLVGIKPNGVHICLGLNQHGEIVGAAHYSGHVMAGRLLIGRVEGLDELEFTVEPVP